MPSAAPASATSYSTLPLPPPQWIQPLLLQPPAWAPNSAFVCVADTSGHVWALDPDTCTPKAVVGPRVGGWQGADVMGLAMLDRAGVPRLLVLSSKCALHLVRIAVEGESLSPSSPLCQVYSSVVD